MDKDIQEAYLARGGDETMQDHGFDVNKDIYLQMTFSTKKFKDRKSFRKQIEKWLKTKGLGKVEVLDVLTYGSPSVGGQDNDITGGHSKFFPGSFYDKDRAQYYVSFVGSDKAIEKLYLMYVSFLTGKKYSKFEELDKQIQDWYGKYVYGSSRSEKYYEQVNLEKQKKELAEAAKEFKRLKKEAVVDGFDSVEDWLKDWKKNKGKAKHVSGYDSFKLAEKIRYIMSDLKRLYGCETYADFLKMSEKDLEKAYKAINTAKSISWSGGSDPCGKRSAGFRVSDGC